MIWIESQLTGGQIAEKLADDPEETWYMLQGLAEDASSDFGDLVAEHAPSLSEEKATVVAFLRGLATKIETQD